MEALILGAVGAIVTIGIFALGVFAGWTVRKYRGSETAEEISEKEKLTLMEEQEAFHRMMSYNQETAYGADD